MAKLWWFCALFIVFGSTSAISELNITSVSMYWNDQIVVCTNDSSKVNTYLYTLITTLEKSTLENTSTALLDTTGNETCLFSKNVYQLDGYYKLSITVEAFEPNGTKVAAGSLAWENIFPRQHPKIQVVATTSFIFVTWDILDNIYWIDGYNLTLYSSIAGTMTSTWIMDASQSTHTFRKLVLGKHSVCIIAMVTDAFPNPIKSNKYCSDIIDIRNNVALPPPIRNMNVLTSSPTSLFVKWGHLDEKRDEVDVQFLVSWYAADQMKSSTLLIQDAHPFALHKDLIDDDGYNLKFVEKSQSSTDIRDLVNGIDFTVCVTVVRNNLAKDSICKSINTGNFEAIDAPADLQYNPASPTNNQGKTPTSKKVDKPTNGSLTWKNSWNVDSFWLKWHRDSDGAQGHAETEADKLDINLPPGKWNISVRGLTKKSASEQTFTNASVNGLIISSQQLDIHSVAIAWDEWPTPEGAVHYNASIKNKGKVMALSQPVFCSGNHTDCVYKFWNLNVPVPASLKILIQNDDESYVQAARTRLESIEDVPVLVQDALNIKEVTIVWEEAQNANIYVLSVYPNKNQTVLRFRTLITLPTRFVLPLKGLDGNVVQVQPCKRADCCGNLKSLTLQDLKPVPREDDDTDTVTILVVIGVSVGLLIGGLSLVKKMRRKYIDDDSDSEYAPIVTNAAWRQTPRYSSITHDTRDTTRR